MRPRYAFVKGVNTIYCASNLGQSQDVDITKPTRPIHQHTNDARTHQYADSPIHRSRAGRYRQVGGALSRPPWCTGRSWGRLCVSPQGAKRTKLPR